METREHPLRDAWNKGKLVGQKAPLKPKDNDRFGSDPVCWQLGKLSFSPEVAWATADSLIAATPSVRRERRQWPTSSPSISGAD